MLVAALLRSMIRTGSLRLIDAAGRSHQIGEAGPPQAAVRLKSVRAEFALALNPALSLGEAYMNGTMVIEQGSLYEANGAHRSQL
jgi:cyclopropane-fatty-acyl-phospholipid synthase